MSEDKLVTGKQVKRKVIGLQPTLDFYVLKEFMLPLTVLIMGFTIIFLIGDLFNTLEDFTSHKGTAAEIFEYFSLKIPGNIRFILPLSVLLACMYTMANFGKNLEITAMRATGISLQRCCGAIYVVAMIVAMINFWFNERLVPYCERRAYRIRQIRKTEGWWKGDRKNLSYRSPDGRRTWLFHSFNAQGIQKKIYLKHFYEDGTLEWEMVAEEGEFIPEKGWKFKKGQLAVFDVENNLPGPPQKFDEKIISIEKFPETPRNIMISVKEIENLASWEIYEILHNTRNMPAKRKALYSTTLFYRLSFFPFACIIAALLGVPLATKNERSGIFISIIVAVLVIMAYIVFSALFRLFGNTGYLPPIIAGAGPTFIFMIFAWVNVVRQN